MPYLIAALQSLLYLSSVPVCVAFCVSGEGGLRAGAGLGAFSARAALKRARRRMARGASPKGGKVNAARLAKLVLRARFERVALSGRVGLSDAAATALLCGGVSALGAALGGRAGSVRIDVAPDFSGVGRLELRGMIRARAGQIMIAAARSQFN